MARKLLLFTFLLLAAACAKKDPRVKLGRNLGKDDANMSDSEKELKKGILDSRKCLLLDQYVANLGGRKDESVLVYTSDLDLETPRTYGSLPTTADDISRARMLSANLAQLIVFQSYGEMLMKSDKDNFVKRFLKVTPPMSCDKEVTFAGNDTKFSVDAKEPKVSEVPTLSLRPGFTRPRTQITGGAPGTLRLMSSKENRTYRDNLDGRLYVSAWSPPPLTSAWSCSSTPGLVFKEEYILIHGSDLEHIRIRSKFAALLNFALGGKIPKSWNGQLTTQSKKTEPAKRDAARNAGWINTTPMEYRQVLETLGVVDAIGEDKVKCAGGTPAPAAPLPTPPPPAAVTPALTTPTPSDNGLDDYS